ncbi:Hypp2480 [Branchiostoma lanceolatum]|uniref:Hypp2480 protein n=1 Tax=Branchiostoma lanceolatum TaxID=7740 RepID=A0A8J9ZVC8_BRALA|nr:Hypp2480 [Branchiostoma lanceolatum]
MNSSYPALAVHNGCALPQARELASVLGPDFYSIGRKIIVKSRSVRSREECGIGGSVPAPFLRGSSAGRDVPLADFASTAGGELPQAGCVLSGAYPEHGPTAPWGQPSRWRSELHVVSGHERTGTDGEEEGNQANHGTELR